MNGCEINKCKYWIGRKCTDPNEYVNRFGESVCGRRDDAILYEDYLDELNRNPPMMTYDKPSEF